MAQTRCDLFGHSWSFWKEGGECYMRCDYCAAVRALNAQDIISLPDPPRHEVNKERDIFGRWDGVLRRLANM